MGIMNNPFSVASSLPPGAREGNPWAVPTLLAILAVSILLLMFHQSAWSAVAIWSRSDTYAHGFVIFPISAFLIWRRRKDITTLVARPDFRGLPLLFLIGFGWLLAYLARVLVVQQFALVAMIPVVVWIILGLRVTRALAFPLGFLLFAVPVGEFLIPPLMEFTANFTVAALQLTDIPVYREGTFFTIPSGQWSVVEGCSGLRYLIASVTLGCLYAYLTYRSAKRRFIFIILSVVVPVIANGMRAYIIVMIAHLSGMKLAVGIDHLIYGWVFFGMVMLLLFWIGARWREDLGMAAPRVRSVSEEALAVRAPVRQTVLATVCALAVSAVWPGYAAYLYGKAAAASPVRLQAPTGSGAWQPDAAPISDWRPRYEGSDASLVQTYRRGNDAVSLYLVYYRHQREGSELITSTNVMVRQKDPVWSNLGESSRPALVGGNTLTITQTKLSSRNLRLLVWNWSRVDDTDTANAHLAKLLEAKAKLLGERDDGAAIIISTPYEDRPDAAAETLQKFMSDMLPAIETTLRQARAGS
jgi:exosortase A